MQTKASKIGFVLKQGQFPPNLKVPGILQLEHIDLINSSLEPDARTEQLVLRAYIPEPA